MRSSVSPQQQHHQSHPSSGSPQTQTQQQQQQSPTGHTLTPIEFAVIQCRNELVRLAKIIEKSNPGAATVSTSDSKKKPESSFFESFSHKIMSFGDDDNENDDNHNKKGDSKNQKRDIAQEYLALARSCQQAAKVSDLEASALRDSMKLIKALREAAEHERDRLEDKLDEKQREIDKLKNLQFQKSVAETVNNNNNKSSSSVASCSQEGNNYNRDASTSATDLSHAEHRDPLNDSEAIPCSDCALLRNQLSDLQEKSKRKEDSLDAEIEEREKKIVELNAEWRAKLQRVSELEQAKSDAKIRRSASIFLQKSATAEAALSKKLLNAELQQLELRSNLSKTLKEMEELRLDHSHAMKEAKDEISSLDHDNKELKRVLHKISAHNEQAEMTGKRTESVNEWTSEDDSVAGEDAKGAFHAWLHASTPAKSSNSSSSPDGTPQKVAVASHLGPSSGIIESARRLLSAKLATDGFVSIEDEVVARALHSTNETLRDALEENMRLQLKVTELEKVTRKK